MRLGIIGSGKVGRALGAWAAKLGDEVAFTSRTASHAQEAARSAGHGARALDLNALVQDAEVLLLTLPYTEIQRTLAPLGEALRGKILVDVTNPITADHRALSLGHITSGAEEIARQFPLAHVVKAFNAVFAEVYATHQAQLSGRPLTLFYAGDDAASKQQVRKLISRMGFDAVDAGPLQNARYLEPLSLLNIHLGRVLGFGTHIGLSLLREPS
ncbi:NADPH-dependent F420 reductase [Stigmatella aurantiaca]|uniref:NADP oxidoreductase, Coenzyme F420-dependent n=1 Tax=Stigmatella aurantiaca (strain DW4/3-1) TaxID=378806 RepID=Q099M7_STIAD|nr:NADPH-dependent F420 reductase [Stigmatella aurantiaca]ADO75838.1 NADP oxidoreductase, coenzyme F420-dependent [Stigmatella aurantiaca DW4/3-1]EAU68467.1 NADP oxidoreductase, coenzyme f420-dependent [Stigmatella aurantiaca DW4/3-1]